MNYSPRRNVFRRGQKEVEEKEVEEKEVEEVEEEEEEVEEELPFQHPERRASVSDFGSRRIRYDLYVDERKLIPLPLGRDLRLEGPPLTLIGGGEHDRVPEGKDRSGKMFAAQTQNLFVEIQRGMSR